MSNQEIASAMRSHHDLMVQQLQDLVQKIETAGPEWKSARDEVAVYLADEVLPHATAEESTVYRIGSTLEILSKLIESMLFDHTVIQSLTESLRGAHAQTQALTVAVQAAKLFEVHAEKENRFIIAVLEPRKDVDLGEVLGDMRQLLAH